MEYYFYENWQDSHKATLHFSDCGYCNHGKGVHPGASANNGRWHGPFTTFQQASTAAQGKGALVKECRHCNPK